MTPVVLPITEYRKAPPERGVFFGLGVHKRVGILNTNEQRSTRDYDVDRCLSSCDLLPLRDTPHNGLYREAPPERGVFFGLWVHKEVGILQVEIYERQGKSVVYMYNRYSVNGN